jgi:hypothetical protein
MSHVALPEAVMAAVIAKRGFSWYSQPMEPTPFELTPKQQGILATLSRATGKPISALLDEALEVLQEHERLHHPADEAPCSPSSPSVLEIFEEARAGIPDAVWKALPEDLAAQHDHYIYGTPKHP